MPAVDTIEIYNWSIILWTPSARAPNEKNILPVSIITLQNSIIKVKVAISSVKNENVIYL